MHMTGREKCNKLKRIRAALASKLGIDLHQVECTFEGECTGTCPKCKQEEDVLNAAILHKGAAVAGAMMLATSMTACVPFGGSSTSPKDSGTVETGGDDLTGEVAPEPDNDPSTKGDDIEFLTGDVDDQSVYGDNTDAKQDDSSDAKKNNGTDAKQTDDGKVVEIVEDLTGYVG